MRMHRRALVRADAGLTIGTGHLSRCLTLADDLATRGWEIQFATRPLPGLLRDDVMRRGHRLIALADGMSSREEHDLIQRELAGQVRDLTIIDHYGLSGDWIQGARSWTRALMAIDDLASAPMDVDLVLNQNLGAQADAYDSLVPDACIRLIGPQYALLRPDFRAARGVAPRVRTGVDRLFVFLGGADEPDATGVVARATNSLGIRSDVIVGAAYPYLDRLRSWSAGVPTVVVHHNVQDLASLMTKADLAIGAPGTASWERCCVGLPTILITLAANQVHAGAALVRAGAAVSLGWFSDLNEPSISGSISALAAAPARLAAMSRAAAGITDGGGLERVIAAIDRLLEGEDKHG